MQRMPGAEKPTATKPLARATAVRLAAEVEGLVADLDASRARISELETRIHVDPLTEVLDRRGFERELNRSLAYVKRYGATAALVYLDLDEFKPINDRHGHGAGDAVLRAIAAALSRDARAPTSSRASAATSSLCCCGTSPRPPPRPKLPRSKLRSTRRRCVVAPRRSSRRVGGRDAHWSARLGCRSAQARADAAMYARKAGQSEYRSRPAARE